MFPAAGAQLTFRWKRPNAEPSTSSGALSHTVSTSTATDRTATDRTATRSTSGPLSHAAAGAPDQLTVGTSQAAWHASLLFLGRCQEILNGYRPATQMRTLAAPAYAQTIVEELTAVTRRTMPVPGLARSGGRRSGRPGPVTRRRIRVCEPRPGVAEATAVLTQDNRSWAVAFRLEKRGRVWLCTNFTDVNQQTADLAPRR